MTDAARLELFHGIIRLFGGTVPVNGFFKKHTLEEYLSAVYGPRLSRFHVPEIIRPAHPDIANAVGYADFTPPQEWFPRVAAMRLINDEVRELVQERVDLGNMWRPAAYNKEVKGAENSAHIHCCACDLDFRSKRAHQKALAFFERIWLAPSPFNYNMGLGVGILRIHYDILSPTRDEKGRDWWKYSGTYPGPEKRWQLNG